MRIFFTLFFVLLFSAYINCSYAQNAPAKHVVADTVKEIVVYEYDTVYLAPDTIKLISDTVKIKKAKTRDLPSHIKEKKISWMVGADVQSFFSDVFCKSAIDDSLTVKKTVNTSVDLRVGISSAKMNYFFTLGLMYLHEKLDYQVSAFTSNKNILAPKPYDSLLVNYTCTSHNYYRYLTTGFAAEKKWGRKKIYFTLGASMSANLLIDHDASLFAGYNKYTSIENSSVRRLEIAAAASTSLGYKLKGKWAFFLSLFYKRYLLNNQKYPVQKQDIAGVSLGVDKFF